MRKSKDAIYSNLKRLDAHTVRPHEYEEAPELTEEQLAAADVHENGKLVRRGRPLSPRRKKEVKLRLDPDIVDELRASGPGWMTRVNAMLRKAVLGQPGARRAAARGKVAPIPRAR
jgi:uncharacterized protein (DUF4415 family)